MHCPLLTIASQLPTNSNLFLTFIAFYPILSHTSIHTQSSASRSYNSTMRRVQRALTAKQNGNTGYMQEGEKDALFQARWANEAITALALANASIIMRFPPQMSFFGRISAIFFTTVCTAKNVSALCSTPPTFCRV